MHHFTPPDTVCFRLEEGLSRVIDHIDHLCGNRSGPRTIKPALRRNPQSMKISPTPDDLALIARMYKADYDVFGYDPLSVSRRSE